MSPTTHEVIFSGRLLRRGFWLYIWDITTPDANHLYYVGRTGDSSSRYAQSPFNRLGQHLGFNKNSNVLRRRLQASGIDADNCTYRLVAYGPIFQEAKTVEEHRERRDRIAAFEKALGAAMTEAGYMVTNPIRCRIELDLEAFEAVRVAFARHFEKLSQSARADNPDQSKNQASTPRGQW